MKKRTVKNKLSIRKNVVSTFKVTSKGGGLGQTFGNCPPTQNGLCTFPAQTCFSKGAGCSNWQVC